MKNYNIKVKEVLKVTYVTQDGQEFETRESAYLHNSYDFMNYILENETGKMKVDKRFFKGGVIDFYKIETREQLDMFLYAYLDCYEVLNEREIIDKAETQTGFPCILCDINNEGNGETLFFKEELANELNAIISKMNDD